MAVVAAGIAAGSVAAPASAICGAGSFALRHIGSTTIEIALSWAPQAGISQYQIQRSTSSAFTTFTTYNVSSATNAYGDTGKLPTDRARFGTSSSLAPGTTYYYRVVADRPSGNDPVSDCITAQLDNGPQRGSSGDLWADIVLGQPDFGQNAYAKTTAAVMQWPGGLAFDTRAGQPTRLYIADTNNNRIIAFDHIGNCTGGTVSGTTCMSDSDCGGGACTPDAEIQIQKVIGQPSAVDVSACNGDGTAQLLPSRAPASNTSLCLIPPTQVSIGETVMAANLEVDAAGALYVTDLYNNRVLRFDDPFNTDSTADAVWGQADYSANQANRGASATCQSLHFETVGGLAFDNSGSMWVADSGNARVLRFPRIGGIIQQTADVVLGQPNCTTTSQGSTARALDKMAFPSDVTFDSQTGWLYVTDSDFSGVSRVLEFRPGFTTGMSAARALPINLTCDIGGHYTRSQELFIDSVSHALWVGNDCFYLDRFDLDSPSLTKLSTTQVPVLYGSGTDPSGDLLALDKWAGNTGQLLRFRRSLFGQSPSSQLQSAQQVFPKTRAGIGPDDLRFGFGGALYGDQLVVADGHRLLIWNGFDLAFATTHMAADDVLGETDLYTATFQNYFAFPQIVGTELWVMHTQNPKDEILVFSSQLGNCMGGGCKPARTIGLNAAAGFTGYPVLGFPGTLMTTAGADFIDFAATPNGDEVWIADSTNSRVYRVVNLKGLRNVSTGAYVDVILGQPSPTSSGCNGHDSAPTANTLCVPYYVSLDASGNLFVSDNGGEGGSTHRLLEFDASAFPASTGTLALVAPNATRVYGTGGSFTTQGTAASQDPLISPLKPAFSPQGYMILPNNPYAATRYPLLFTAPLASTLPQLALGDFTGFASGSPFFDSEGNLYLYDTDWSRLLIYKTPFEKLTFPNPQPTPTRDGTHTPTATPTPYAGPNYAATVLSDSPTGYYHLGELSGAIAFDSSGGGFHAAYSGSGVGKGLPSLLTSTSDKSISVDGANGAVIAPQTADTAAYTIEAWFKPSGTDSGTMAPRVVVLRVNAGGNYVQELTVQRFGSEARFQHRVFLTSTAELIVTSSRTVTPGQTYHLVGTAANGGFVRLFVNGVEEGTPLPVTTLAAGDHWQMGYAAGGGWSNGFGQLDEIAFYGQALSAERIIAHFSAGSGQAAPATPTPTFTISATPTSTGAATRTPTVTATTTATRTHTATPSPTHTASPSGTVTEIEPPLPTQTPSPTGTPFRCPPEPIVGCRVSLKSSFSLKYATLPTRNSMTWKWTRGATTDTAEFGNPLESTGYTLCIYDDAPAPLLVGQFFVPAARICGTKACWATSRLTGFRYLDRLKAADGILRTRLYSGVAGKASIIMVGKGLALPLPVPLSPTQFLNQAPAVIVQLQKSDGPPCWEASYTASARRNTGTWFNAVTP